MTNHIPPELYRRDRGHDFYPPEGVWKDIPAIYAQDGKGMEAVVYLHYFAPWGDWYVTEVDHETGIAFGWAMLGSDLVNAELGYTDLPALESVSNHPMIVERDLHFKAKPLRDVLTEVRKRFGEG